MPTFDDLLPTDTGTPDPPTPLVIVGILTEQGVNMGDHGQDVTRAVVIDPDETVRDLCERVLRRAKGWPSKAEADPDLYLTLRAAVTR